MSEAGRKAKERFSFCTPEVKRTEEEYAKINAMYDCHKEAFEQIVMRDKNGEPYEITKPLYISPPGFAPYFQTYIPIPENWKKIADQIQEKNRIKRLQEKNKIKIKQLKEKNKELEKELEKLQYELDKEE